MHGRACQSGIAAAVARDAERGSDMAEKAAVAVSTAPSIPPYDKRRAQQREPTLQVRSRRLGAGRGTAPVIVAMVICVLASGTGAGTDAGAAGRGRSSTTEAMTSSARSGGAFGSYQARLTPGTRIPAADAEWHGQQCGTSCRGTRTKEDCVELVVHVHRKST